MLLADLIKSISSLPSDDKRLKNLLLRNYLQFNLIYFTFVGLSGEIWWCVLRQERFVEKMNTTLNWLHSPFIYQTLSESLTVCKFFHMLTSSDLKRMLVPTLDIDLMWHTINYGIMVISKIVWNHRVIRGLIMMILLMKINWTMVMNTPVKCIASYSNRNIQFAIVILVLCDAGC